MTTNVNPPPAPLPPFVRRHEVTVVAVSLFLIVGFGATPFVARLAGRLFPSLWTFAGIFVLGLAMLAAVFVAARWRRARIKRAVKAAEGCACTSCVYDLGGLGGTGTCPECGHRFDLDADRRSWERAKML